MRVLCHEWQSEDSWKSFVATGVSFEGGAAARPLIVVFDRLFQLLDLEERNRRLDLVKQECGHLFRKQIKVLFLAEFPDQGYTPKDFLRHPLGPLRSLGELLKPFAHRLPMDGEAVSQITGGYAGFGEQLIRDAWIEFEGWVGAEQVGAGAPWRLIRDSFRAGGIRSEFATFIERATDSAGGFSVVDHIRKVLRDRYERVGADLLKLVAANQMTIDFSVLLQKKGFSAGECAVYLGFLREHGIVRGDDENHRIMGLRGTVWAD